MKSVNPHILRWSVLIITVALIALALVALACGPSAQTGQNGEDADPKPTPTPTATTEPTPEPTPKLLSHVSQSMYRLVEEERKRQSSDDPRRSADDSPALPDSIFISINALSSQMESLKTLLEDGGATNIEQSDDYIISAQIPPLLMGKITRHEGYLSSFTTGLYADKMDQTLDADITQYEAGDITAVEAANRIRGWSSDRFPELVSNVEIHIDSSSNADTVRDHIIDNGGYVAAYDDDATVLDASVMVPTFSSLYAMTSVEMIRRGTVGQTQPVPAPSSSVSPNAQPMRPGQQGVFTLQGLYAHGAEHWHNAPYSVDGDGVKIGIIDYGFENFNTLPSTQRPATADTHWKCEDHMTHAVTNGTGALGAACDTSPNEPTSNHGTMVAESAYDVAPGATYYISNLPPSDAATWMKAQGVKIINPVSSPVDSGGAVFVGRRQLRRGVAS